MLAAIAIAAVLVALVGLAVAFAFMRKPGAGRRDVVGPHGAIVVIDIGAASPQHPSVVRLARNAGSSAIAADPSLQGVEVWDQSGRRLALFPPGAGPRVKPIAMPSLGRDQRRAYVPGPHRETDDAAPATSPPKFVPAGRERPRQPFADRFELPDSVRRRIRSPDDPVDVVRAILEASGRNVSRSGDVLLTGDEATIVVGAGHDALNHAYLAFRESGARHGIVIGAGLLSQTEIRRREMLVPELGHASADAVQRMADAVAIGVDPMRYALPPRAVAG